MRQLFLSAIAVVCSFWSIAQTSNKNKFDTLKLSGVSYTVYKDWRTQLSKKYELDSAGASDMNQKLIFARTNNGMVYSVRNKQNHDLVATYESPTLLLQVTQKKDFTEFFKAAPKGVFNPALVNKDTVNILVGYYRQYHNDDKSKAQTYNMKFVQDIFSNTYKKFNIGLLPANQTTPESLKENQQKTKMLTDSAYVIVDSAVSNDGSRFRIFGLFETDEQRKETTLTYFGVTRFTVMGSLNLSIQYYFYVSTNKLHIISATERKNGFFIFFQ
ncbi:MAG: hypothetical protein IPL04_05445 [Chitinophagaceae bacterium]|nr:hypothetical protein [Chitinophagaceae bacterium]